MLAPQAPDPVAVAIYGDLAGSVAESANFDALALAVAQQNNLIASIALLIGVVGLFGLVGWGLFIKLWAERTAKDTAREWLEKNAGELLAEMSSALQVPRSASGAGPLAPDEQAEELEKEGAKPP